MTEPIIEGKKCPFTASLLVTTSKLGQEQAGIVCIPCLGNQCKFFKTDTECNIVILLDKMISDK